MNQKRVKLFRPLFSNKQDFRRFKRAYTGRDLATRLETIRVAKRAKGKQIHHLEVPDAK